MSHFSIDYETSSACDIKLGAYRYACDPTTRIIMFAIAKDDGDPVIWDCTEPEAPESLRAKAMLKEAVRTGGEIYAFNASFEAAISKYRLLEDLGLEPPALEQWRCVQAVARVASAPVSLGKAAEFLKLRDKDTAGKALIHIFSDQTRTATLKLKPPHKRGNKTLKARHIIGMNPIPWDHTLTVAGRTVTVREAWSMFRQYCVTDVLVEREVRKKLAKFELSESELAGYHFTLRMNDMGTPVNIPAVRNAAKILATRRKELEERFVAITGLMPTQTAKVLAWLKAEGFPANNLQAATMREWIGSDVLTYTGKVALAIRSELSFAAIKKIAAMSDSACDDDTLKGMFTWYGASATGRWTSQGVQLQNVRKSSIPNPDLAYKLIRDGADSELLEIVSGNPYEAVASVIRNFIQPHTGRMYSVDFSNIESRVAAWLAGQESQLATYREGRDAYRELAAEVFNVPLDQVTKEQRFVGKVGILSLVFQTGAKTFHETCAAWGNPIPKKVACNTVRVFREANEGFPKTWRAYEAAAVKAIQNPGQWFEASPFVSFACTTKAPFHRLVMRLPSGRTLVYPYPEVERAMKRHTDYETGETREWETKDITFYGRLRGFTGWGRVGLFAGLLFQNSVQATARDIMQHGCVNAESLGHRIFSIIHDEVLAYEHPEGHEGLAAALCELPTWLPNDFPLTATGGECDYYTKD